MDKNKRAHEAIERIRHCIMNDKCELIDCGYYGALSSLTEVIEYIDSCKPHVLTIEEIADEEAYCDGECPLWIEYKEFDEPLNAVIMHYNPYIKTNGGNGITFTWCGNYAQIDERLAEYNITWRLWSAKPSKAQLQETKWDSEWLLIDKEEEMEREENE